VTKSSSNATLSRKRERKHESNSHGERKTNVQIINIVIFNSKVRVDRCCKNILWYNVSAKLFKTHRCDWHHRIFRWSTDKFWKSHSRKLLAESLCVGLRMFIHHKILLIFPEKKVKIWDYKELQGSLWELLRGEWEYFLLRVNRFSRLTLDQKKKKTRERLMVPEIALLVKPSIYDQKKNN